jgi:hypothetical protein
MKTTMRRRIAIILSACIAVTTLTLVGAGSATANTTTLQETTGYGYVVNWDTPRTNMKNPSASTFRMNSQSPGTGAPFALGLRNGSGQFARAEAYPGGSAALALSNGSTALPQGTFYLNTKVQGACGGSGCGQVTWNITFNWNL